jgi:hypothetical protein
VTQQLKDLQSDEVADAVLQYIQQWPEEARMWAERKVRALFFWYEASACVRPCGVWRNSFSRLPLISCAIFYARS